MYAFLTYLPIYFQIVQNDSPTQKAGLNTLPLVLSMVVTSIGSGQVISCTHKYRFYPLVGSLLVALGNICLLCLSTSTTLLYVGMSIIGLGLGLLVGPLMLIVQNTVSQGDMAVATATATFLRTIGGALAVAVYGAILTDSLSEHLPPNLDYLVI